MHSLRLHSAVFACRVVAIPANGMQNGKFVLYHDETRYTLLNGIKKSPPTPPFSTPFKSYGGGLSACELVVFRGTSPVLLLKSYSAAVGPRSVGQWPNAYPRRCERGLDHLHAERPQKGRVRRFL